MGSEGVLEMDRILDSQNLMLFLATAGNDKISHIYKTSHSIVLNISQSVQNIT